MITCSFPGCGQPVRWLAAPEVHVHVEGINAHVKAGVADHNAIVSNLERQGAR